MNRTGLFQASEVDPTYHLPFDLEANNELPPFRWNDLFSMVGFFLWEALKCAFCIFSTLAVVLAMYGLMGGGK